MELGTWTIERVKAELPDVAVSIANQPRVMCQIGGRKEKFATVWVNQYSKFEFAWQSIADALNFDRALII